MQDLKALEGKSLAELREIGKALGIPHLMMKKKDLIEKILNFTQDGGVADTETQQSPAEAPKKTRRPRIAKTESTQASVEIREQPAAQTTTTPTPAAPKEGGKRRGRPSRKEQAAPSFAGTDTSKPEIKKIALDGETCPGMHEEPQTLPTTHPTEEIITKDDFAVEIAGEGVLSQIVTDIHLYEGEQLRIVNVIALVDEYNDCRNAYLTSQKDVLLGLSHRAISTSNNEDSAVHLSSTGDHVLDIVSMPGAVNVRVVTLLSLILTVSGVDCAATLSLLRSLIDLIVSFELSLALKGQPLCDSCSSSGLAVVNVTDGADVYVGLSGIIMFLCHWYFLLNR